MEGIGGFRYLNGFPGEAPVRPNLSLGDTLAGLHAALGILLALVERGKSSTGQLVDVAIYESVFNVLESVVPEYDGAGLVREPSGTTLTGIVPTNTYPCRDGRHVIIGGNGDSIYRRLMRAAGRADLAEDPRLAHNAGRVEHEKLIDDALAEWTRSLDSAEVLSRLAEADVPSGPIYSVADIMEDPHYRAREMFHRVEIDGEPLVLPGMSPRLGTTRAAPRGRDRSSGPTTGKFSRSGWDSGRPRSRRCAARGCCEPGGRRSRRGARADRGRGAALRPRAGERHPRRGGQDQAREPHPGGMGGRAAPVRRELRPGGGREARHSLRSLRPRGYRVALRGRPPSQQVADGGGALRLGSDRGPAAHRAALERPAPAFLPPLNVCLQVNASEESSKSGVRVEEAADLAAAVAELPRLRLRGLMAIPRPCTGFDEQRGALRPLVEAYERLRGDGLALDTLSMGMTDDLAAAVAEGTTMVRIGTAVFGPRGESVT